MYKVTLKDVLYDLDTRGSTYYKGLQLNSHKGSYSIVKKGKIYPITKTKAMELVKAIKEDMEKIVVDLGVFKYKRITSAMYNKYTSNYSLMLIDNAKSDFNKYRKYRWVIVSVSGSLEDAIVISEKYKVWRVLTMEEEHSLVGRIL